MRCAGGAPAASSAASPVQGPRAEASGAPAVACAVASEPTATASVRSSPPRNTSTRNPTMISGPHRASMLRKPPACSCIESRDAPGCIGAGGRGASKVGPVSGEDAAYGIPALSTAASVPVPAALGAADPAVEALAEPVLDAAATVPEAGFSRLVAAFAVFFVVLAAEVVFVAVFFCAAFFTTFFAASWQRPECRDARAPRLRVRDPAPCPSRSCRRSSLDLPFVAAMLSRRIGALSRPARPLRRRRGAIRVSSPAPNGCPLPSRDRNRAVPGKARPDAGAPRATRRTSAGLQTLGHRSRWALVLLRSHR